MKTTKQLEKEIKERTASGVYFANQQYSEDGVKHWKIAANVYRQNGNKWELISNQGIKNPEFRGIRFNSMGQAY